MKKKLMLLAMLILTLVITVGCDANGQKYLDNMIKTNQIKVSDQTIELTYRLNLEEMLALMASFDDSSADMPQELRDKLHVYPEINLTMVGKSYNDMVNPQDIFANVSYDVHLTMFGTTLIKNNIQFIVDDNVLYMSKSYIDFIYDSAILLAENFGTVDDIAEIEQLKADLARHNAEYLSVDLFDSTATDGERAAQYVQSYEDVMALNQQVLEMMQASKTWDFDVDVEKQGERYSASLDITEMIALISQFVDYAAANKEFVTEHINDQQTREAVKTLIDEMKSEFDQVGNQATLSLIKTTLEGSRLKISNKFEDDKAENAFDMHLVIMDYDILDIAAETQIEETTASRPADNYKKQAVNFEDFFY